MSVTMLHKAVQSQYSFTGSILFLNPLSKSYPSPCHCKVEAFTAIHLLQLIFITFREPIH
jgi:hypothetical protein